MGQPVHQTEKQVFMVQMEIVILAQLEALLQQIQIIIVPTVSLEFIAVIHQVEITDQITEINVFPQDAAHFGAVREAIM